MILLLEAIHKTTSRGYSGREIWDKFDDPRKEEWICCPTDQKPVTPVVEHSRLINNEKIFVVPHFRLLEGQGGCISVESDAHKKAKILLASLIDNKRIQLQIGRSFVPYSSLEFKEVPRLPFRWEQKRKQRRADVLFELRQWHNVLGQGLVFEIQTSNLSEEERRKREIDWISNGYSLTWLDTIEFAENSLTSNTIEIEYVWALEFAKVVQEMVRKIRSLNIQFNQLLADYEDKSVHTCRTCLHGSPDRTHSELIACWYGTRWGRTEQAKGYRKYPSLHEPLDSCSDYDGSKEN